MITGNDIFDAIIIIVLLCTIPIPIAGFLSLILILLIESPLEFGVIILLGIGIHAALVVSFVVMLVTFFGPRDSIFRSISIILLGQNIVVGCIMIIWFWVIVLEYFGIFISLIPLGTLLVVATIYWKKNTPKICECIGQPECSCSNL